jgi:hypothetical protein
MNNPLMIAAVIPMTFKNVFNDLGILPLPCWFVEKKGLSKYYDFFRFMSILILIGAFKNKIGIL